MRFLAAFLIVLALALASPKRCEGGQNTEGVVRGEVTDSSGGVLPGVTVTAFSQDGRVIGTAVTDRVGTYIMRLQPLGPVKLVFELDGFEPSSILLMINPGVELRAVERLKLAKLTEEVVVYGKAPPPPPPPPPPYVPPPPPTIIPVPAEELETMCRPAKAGSIGPLFGTIKAHRYAEGRTIYGKGDELVIQGGKSNGIDVGQNLVARRFFRGNSKAAQFPELGEHTAGLVQIIEATEHSSTGIVIHVCNEVMQGDLLASFIPERLHAPDASGTPAFDEAARILFGDAGNMLGAPRRLMVIDRGSDQGIRPGQRVTLFRKRPEAMPSVLGEAIVISVRADSATIRIVRTTDAIEFGDWAAPQRP